MVEAWWTSVLELHDGTSVMFYAFSGIFGAQLIKPHIKKYFRGTLCSLSGGDGLME